MPSPTVHEEHAVRPVGQGSLKAGLVVMNLLLWSEWLGAPKGTSSMGLFVVRNQTTDHFPYLLVCGQDHNHRWFPHSGIVVVNDDLKEGLVYVWLNHRASGLLLVRNCLANLGLLKNLLVLWIHSVTASIKPWLCFQHPAFLPSFFPPNELLGQ